MKQRLLLRMLILFSISVYSQVQGVPPVGYTLVYGCDTDGDGFAIFDLTEIDTFITVDGTNYYEPEYYGSLTDLNTRTNPILNPESYTNIEQAQEAYIRVDPINSMTSNVLFFSLQLNAIITPSINQPTNFEVCDDEGFDGIATFDLSSKNTEILGNLTDVEIKYYSSQIDADLGINFLLVSYTSSTSLETIYVRVEDLITGCYSTTSLDLIVQDCSTLGVIEVNTFYDANTNNTFENDEINFLNGLLTYEKNNDGIQRNLYSSNGIYNIISDDENDTYDISYNILYEYNSCYNVTTTSYEDINVTNGNTVNYNFPITKIQDCGDIAVYLMSYASPRPGFDYKNRLVIINKGLETVTSGSIEFTHDPIVTFNNVSYVDTGDTGNSITNTSTGFILDFVNLEPNQSESVIIRMNVPIPTSLGTLLTNTATYAVADLSIENNTSILSETVIGSYDPNDIAESKGPEILYAEFSSTDYLYYTVRFQNVGTADAINVSIDNTLDSRLDKSTIQMLSSSHTNVFTRIEDQLNWKFDNIHLPSEDMDEPNSHGYVYYKIKPLVGYKVGDIIPNTAEIYFDFNDPVITNTFETEFITTLSNSKFNNTGFSIYPNPAKNIIELKFSRTINNIINTSIYNIQGKLILDSKNNIQNSEIQLNVSSLKSGIYFLKVNDGISKITQKLIIE
ncbi:MAG: T9SS type A sorting domain-containing protein [Algibacter sp.]